MTRIAIACVLLAGLLAPLAGAQEPDVCKSYLVTPESKLRRAVAREIRPVFLDFPFFPKRRIGVSVRCYVAIVEALRDETVLSCAAGSFKEEEQAQYDKTLSEAASYCLSLAFEAALQ